MPAPGYGLTSAVGAFPLVEDVDILGGFHVVATTTARDAIPLLNQKVGMWCWVTAAGGTLYQLTATGTPGTWAAVSFGASAPAGTGPVKASGGAFSVAAINLASAEVTGTLPAANQAAQTVGGDGSGTTASLVITKINGVAVSGTPASGYALIASGATAAAWVAPPTGTGITFYTGGVRSSTARSLDLAADGGTMFTGVLPVANQASQIGAISTVTGTPAAGYRLVATSGTAAQWQAPAASVSSGTGFGYYISGVLQSAAKKVDLVNDIDTATVLPAANGGGQVLYPTQNTSTGTPVLLATTPAIPSGGGISVFGHILFDDGAGNLYDQVGQGLWKNVGGTVTGVSTPAPPNGNGPLLGCALSFVINSTTKKIEMYGTLSGTAIGTTINMTPELTATTR